MTNTANTKVSVEEKDNRAAELRKHWESTFQALGIPDAHYAPRSLMYNKFWRVPLKEAYSVWGEGEDIYTEDVDFNVVLKSRKRKLFCIKRVENPDSIYQVEDTKIGEQYVIPVDDVKEVAITDTDFFAAETNEEDADCHMSDLTGRDIIATLLRLPQATKPWINQMITDSKKPALNGK